MELETLSGSGKPETKSSQDEISYNEEKQSNTKNKKTTASSKIIKDLQQQSRKYTYCKKSCVVWILAALHLSVH